MGCDGMGSDMFSSLHSVVRMDIILHSSCRILPHLCLPGVEIGLDSGRALDVVDPLEVGLPPKALERDRLLLHSPKYPQFDLLVCRAVLRGYKRVVAPLQLVGASGTA